MKSQSFASGLTTDERNVLARLLANPIYELIPLASAREHAAMLPAGVPVTVTAEVSLLPSLVAIIAAFPTATADATPLPSTVAIPLAVDRQEIARPVSTAPRESHVVALNDALVPTRKVSDAGVMAIDATGIGVTSTRAVSVIPDVSTANTVSRPVRLPAR